MIKNKKKIRLLWSVSATAISSAWNLGFMLAVSRFYESGPAADYSVLFNTCFIALAMTNSFVFSPYKVQVVNAGKVDRAEETPYLITSVISACVLSISFSLVLGFFLEGVSWSSAVIFLAASILVEFSKLRMIVRERYRHLVQFEVFRVIFKLSLVIGGGVYSEGLLKVNDLLILVSSVDLLASFILNSRIKVSFSALSWLKSLSYSFRFGRWVFIESISHSIISRSPVYILLGVGLQESVVEYSIILSVLGLVNPVYMGYVNYFSVAIRKRYTKTIEVGRDYRALKGSVFTGAFKLTLALIVILSIISLFGPSLVLIVTGGSVATGYVQFVSLSFYILFLALSIFLSNVARSFSQPQFGAKAKVLSCGVFLTLAALLVVLDSVTLLWVSVIVVFSQLLVLIVVREKVKGWFE